MLNCLNKLLKLILGLINFYHKVNPGELIKLLLVTGVNYIFLLILNLIYKKTYFSEA